MKFYKWLFILCSAQILFSNESPSTDCLPIAKNHCRTHCRIYRNQPMAKNCKPQTVCFYPERQGFLEGNVGYFYPFSSDLRSIVGQGIDYQLSFTYKIGERFGLFASADFFTKDGRSTGDHSKTSLWILPISLGIKVFATFWQSDNRFEELDFYFAIAPRYYLSSATNHASYVDHKNFAKGIGGMGGIGMIYSYGHLSLDAFLDVSYSKIHSHTSIPKVKTPNVQVGSLVAGGGIGYNF